MGGCSCMQKKNKYNSPTCSSHLVYIGLYRVVCCISQKLLLFLSVGSLFDFLQFSVQCGELGGGKGVCFSVFVNVNAQDVCVWGGVIIILFFQAVSKTRITARSKSTVEIYTCIAHCTPYYVGVLRRRWCVEGNSFKKWFCATRHCSGDSSIGCQFCSSSTTLNKTPSN